MDQPTVLIISDDPEFSRSVTFRWQSERNLPSFTLMSTAVRFDFDPESFQLAIAGEVRSQAAAQFRVGGLIDVAHATAAEVRRDFVTSVISTLSFRGLPIRGVLALLALFTVLRWSLRRS